MTALCGGGESRAKSGVAEAIIFASGAIASVLNNRGRAWASVVAPLVGVISYDAQQLCNSDPPAEPTFVGQDFIDVINPLDPVKYIAALNKFKDLIEYLAWFEFCECVDVSTPAPPAPVAAPTGMPDVTGVYSQVPSQPCVHYDSGRIVSPLVSDTPSTVYVGPDDHDISGTHTMAIHSGATSYRVQLTNYDDGTASDQITYAFGSYKSDNTFTSDVHSGTLFPGASLDSGLVAIPTTAAYQFFYWSRGGSDHGEDSTQQGIIDFYCGATPTNPNGSNCAPDPMVLGLLNQILVLVELQQRQTAPFAYVLGDNHPDLSGSGTIDVTGLLGVLVQVTSTSTATGLQLSTPNRLWEAGAISFGTADGYRHQQWITTPLEIMAPPLFGIYTSVAYDLVPGVTIAIQELRREP